MALYREGKAAMSADGTVTGTGTKWQSSLSLIRPGATIMFLSSPIQMAVVNKVVSDTEIKAITTKGAIVASTDYAILLSDSLTVDGLAQDVAETLRYYQSQETVIADAVEFFKEFDFESLQNLANQIKADSEAAEASSAAAAASESKAKTSEDNAKSSENAAKNSEVAAEATRDQIQQIINDAGEQSTLVVLAQPSGAGKIGLQKGGTVQDAIYWITLEMFGAKGDGVYDDAIAFQAAVNFSEAINSSVSTRAPRVGIHFAAKKYYLKQPVKVTKGTVYWQGAGMYQTVFTPHPEANSPELQYKYFFDFSSPSWVSNVTRKLQEVHLRNFTFLGDGVTLRPVFYLGGVGWDCVFDTVHVWSAGLSAIVADDLFDTQFYNLRINSCGYLHNPANAEDIFTHPIMFRGKYDNCNAIRFIAPHLENNFTGVISITGRSNNISFTAMPKFENNSRGAASGAVYPVISINGSLAESIKIDNPFVSHPANVKAWFIESNSRHLSLRGGSYMSPSDTSGQTAKKWIRIHRDGWASATRCVGAVIDIDTMHVDGVGDTGVAPIIIENDAVVNIKAPRVVNPNRFIDILYDCQVTIDQLTVLGNITAENQTALFNVDGESVKADITVKQQQGDVNGLIYVNSDMTTASRRKSKIILRSQNYQNGVGSLVSGTDPIGYDEGHVFQASGLVSSIGYCHTGKRMTVRCPDTANCLVAGGNIFLPGGAVTSACTITLMATNFAFRQGWTEISRVNGV